MIVRGVTPAVPAGAHAEALLGSQREVRPHMGCATMDSSMLVRAAVETLKLPALVYGRYIDRVFGGFDNMDEADLFDQAAAFRLAEQDPKVAAQFKRAIEAKGRGQS